MERKQLERKVAGLPVWATSKVINILSGITEPVEGIDFQVLQDKYVKVSVQKDPVLWRVWTIEK